MLNKIDKKITKNPNISKEELIDAMIKSSAVENFLNTCINMRLNQHLNCVRREDHINIPITTGSAITKPTKFYRSIRLVEPVFL